MQFSLGSYTRKTNPVYKTQKGDYLIEVQHLKETLLYQTKSNTYTEDFHSMKQTTYFINN